jgi:hypothetical protein
MRSSFKAAAQAAGLKGIPMYNLRHSFGTGLARGGIDVRTISALMRHARITTTEQYMAYAPQADLAERLTRALSPATASVCLETNRGGPTCGGEAELSGQAGPAGLRRPTAVGAALSRAA